MISHKENNSQCRTELWVYPHLNSHNICGNCFIILWFSDTFLFQGQRYVHYLESNDFRGHYVAQYIWLNHTRFPSLVHTCEILLYQGVPFRATETIGGWYFIIRYKNNCRRKFLITRKSFYFVHFKSSAVKHHYNHISLVREFLYNERLNYYWIATVSVALNIERALCWRQLSKFVSLLPHET